MNKWIGIGNLVDDPNTHTTSGGQLNCSFRIAVQRRFSNANGVREADFLTVVCWRKTAEVCAKYLHKGMKVCIDGSIRTRSYTAQDGSKRNVVEIEAENVEFLNSKNADEERAVNEAAAPSVPPHQMGFTEVDDDDLPF